MASKITFEGSSLDEIVLYLDALVCKQQLDELRMLARVLGAEEEAKKVGENVRSTKRVVVKAYEGICDDEEMSVDEKKKIIMDLIDQLHTEAKKKEKDAANDSDVEENKDKDKDTKKKLLKDHDEGKRDFFLREFDVLKKTSLLRKELKIKGQIGEASQKDKLSYISLMHQINEAKASGYDDDEIVSSVIKAMVPSLTLRNVLETTKDLTLKRLHQFLEAHYEEKNATELCSKLTSSIQLPEETPYSFVMRCIELRQKLLITAAKSDIPYDATLVSKLFRRTLENGLLSTFILQEIKPLLKSDLTTDEDLIAAVSKASSSEKERISALSRNKKPLKINSVASSQADPKLDQLLSVVTNLTKQVADLQSEVAKVKPTRGIRKSIPKCGKCLENKSERCNHCFKCGSSEHMARGCMKDRKPKEN